MASTVLQHRTLKNPPNPFIHWMIAVQQTEFPMHRLGVYRHEVLGRIETVSWPKSAVTL
jgi:hypothetical protein